MKDRLMGVQRIQGNYLEVVCNDKGLNQGNGSDHRKEKRNLRKYSEVKSLGVSCYENMGIEVGGSQAHAGALVTGPFPEPGNNTFGHAAFEMPPGNSK